MILKFLSLPEWGYFFLLYKNYGKVMVWLIGNQGMLGTDVENLLKNKRLEYTASDIDVDITQYSVLRNYAKDKNIEWVINCAAYTAVDKAEDEKELAFKINATGAENIARICREIGAKLIHISTDYVFDGQKKSPYTEDDRPNPLGVYGKSKLAGEESVRSILNNYYIVRTSWLYGKNGGNFVRTMIGLFGQRDEVKVVSDQWGTPTYTRDLAEAVIRIVELDKDEFGIYNFSNEGSRAKIGENIEVGTNLDDFTIAVNHGAVVLPEGYTEAGITWYDFAVEIYRISRESGIVVGEVKIIPIKTEEYPTRAKRPRNSLLSKEKIKKTFGLKIRPWQVSLKDFITHELRG